MTDTDSILKLTKLALGLSESDTAFDTQLVMYINSVFGNLTQLGFGPDTGFEISDDTKNWSDYIEDELRYNGVKTYMYLKVKMLFDPPSIGFVITAMEKMILELEWRLNVQREEIVHPPVLGDIERDEFGDPVSVDGGDLDAP